MSNNLGNMQRNGAALSSVPAELAPFFSQHHKWSWSRPEWSTARTLLCADSIRSNCILASFHSSPPSPPWSDTLLYFCAVSYSMVRERGKEHCSTVAACYFFLNIHIPLDCMRSCTEPPLIWKKYFSAAPGFKAPTITVVFIIIESVTIQVSWPHFL